MPIILDDDLQDVMRIKYKCCHCDKSHSRLEAMGLSQDGALKTWLGEMRRVLNYTCPAKMVIMELHFLTVTTNFWSTPEKFEEKVRNELERRSRTSNKTGSDST